jgi:hypothetical protein
MAKPEPAVDWVYIHREGAVNCADYMVFVHEGTLMGNALEAERQLKTLIGHLWDTIGAIRVSEAARLNRAAGLDPGAELRLPGRAYTGKHHL